MGGWSFTSMHASEILVNVITLKIMQKEAEAALTSESGDANVAKEDGDQFRIKDMISDPIYTSMSTYNKIAVKNTERFLNSKHLRFGMGSTLFDNIHNLQSFNLFETESLLGSAGTLLGCLISNPDADKPNLRLFQTGDSLFMHFNKHGLIGDRFYYLPTFITNDMQKGFNAPDQIGNTDISSVRDYLFSNLNKEPNENKMRYVFNEKAKTFLKEFNVPVETDDILLMASDGLYDNLSAPLISIFLNFVLYTLEQADSKNEAPQDPTSLLYELVDEIVEMYTSSDKNFYRYMATIQEERQSFQKLYKYIIKDKTDNNSYKFSQNVTKVLKGLKILDEGMRKQKISPELYNESHEMLEESNRTVTDVNIKKLSEEANVLNLNYYKPRQPLTEAQLNSLLEERKKKFERLNSNFSDFDEELKDVEAYLSDKFNKRPSSRGFVESFGSKSVINFIKARNDQQNPTKPGVLFIDTSFDTDSLYEDSHDRDSEVISKKSPSSSNRSDHSRNQSFTERFFNIISKVKHGSVYGSPNKEEEVKKQIMNNNLFGMTGKKPTENKGKGQTFEEHKTSVMLKRLKNASVIPNKISNSSSAINNNSSANVYVNMTAFPFPNVVSRNPYLNNKSADQLVHTNVPSSINSQDTRQVLPMIKDINKLVSTQTSNILAENVKSRSNSRDYPHIKFLGARKDFSFASNKEQLSFTNNQKPRPSTVFSSNTQSTELPKIENRNARVNKLKSRLFNNRILASDVLTGSNCNLLNLYDYPVETDDYNINKVELSECVVKLTKKIAVKVNLLPKFGYSYLSKALAGAAHYISKKGEMDVSSFGVKAMLFGEQESGTKSDDITVITGMVKNDEIYDTVENEQIKNEIDKRLKNISRKFSSDVSVFLKNIADTKDYVREFLSTKRGIN